MCVCVREREFVVKSERNGREWQGKYFTNLNAWKVESSTASAPVPGSFDTMPVHNPSGDFPDSGLPADFNDLPF